MRLGKSIDEKTIAKKMIFNALSMEESLAVLLHAEAKIIKKQLKDDNFNYEKINHINKTIKYILFSLTMVDDRIQTGLDLYKKSTSKSDEKT